MVINGSRSGQVIATVMAKGHSPNQLVYTVDINKNNVSTVYRADEDVTTWLLQDLLSVDTVIHLHDVSRIVNGSDTFGIIKINNEKIRYSSIDLQNNTLSGLTRGILGTSTSDLHSKFDIACLLYTSPSPRD